MLRNNLLCGDLLFLFIGDVFRRLKGFHSGGELFDRVEFFPNF